MKRWAWIQTVRIARHLADRLAMAVMLIAVLAVAVAVFALLRGNWIVIHY